MELLAPAGNYEKFLTALHFGADAIYLAGNAYGLRAFAGNFSRDELEKATKIAHMNGKKVYVTINIIAKEPDFEGLDEYLSFLHKKAKVDAVIVADIGVMEYIKQHEPDLDIHVSTQANITNSYSAKLFEKLGAKRLILARELSIEQIKEIRKAVSVELEVFVHGAMCMAYSGRCLLSNYLTGRDSNHGECVQACRWKYTVKEVSRDDELEVQEDENGCYIFNSKDLNMIEHLKTLSDIGIDSIKIEGRMKSAYYVATVTNAYRKALDMLPNKPTKAIISELEKASHRPYTTGFYFNETDRQNREASAPVQDYTFVALVTKDSDGKTCEVEMRNKFSIGEELEILSSNLDLLNKTITINSIISSQGESVDCAKNVQERLTINCALPLKAGDILRKTND